MLHGSTRRTRVEKNMLPVAYSSDLCDKTGAFKPLRKGKNIQYTRVVQVSHLYATHGETKARVAYKEG